MFDLIPTVKKTKVSLDDVTVIIKTFLRDEYAKDCILSLRKYWGNIKIVLADDGHMTPEKEAFYKAQKVEYYHLPWDQGVCVGRNFLIDKVKTPYLVVGDDDFEYGLDANLDELRILMEVADLAGGAIREKGAVHHYEAFMTIDGSLMVYKALPMSDWDVHKDVKYKACDLTYNFFMIKTEVAQRVRWDEKIHVMYEHSDFFLRLKPSKVVYAPNSIADHKLKYHHPTQQYQASRFSKADRPYFFEKWGLTRRIDMHGFVDEI